MAVIQVIKGPLLGKVFLVERPLTVMGRHPGCDIVLDVAAVSRQHAQILRDGDKFFLEDLGSRNRTFLNDAETHGRAPLHEGDKFRICDLDFAFFIDPPSVQLAGPGLLAEDPSSIALIVDDDQEETGTAAPFLSKLDVVSSRSGSFMIVKPEVKLRALIEISQNLGGTLAVDEVLPKLLDNLFKIFMQADRGFIILKSGPEGRLIPKAVKHRRSDATETARISRTIIRQVMEKKEAILSADAASDERFELSQSIADFHIRSLMCAPLLDSESRALGVIQIDTLDRRSRFTDEDLEVLASVASQAAIAIENAELHEQTLRQKGLERDLDLAQKVQQALLPSESPAVAGYQFFSFYDAAGQVGGDYYDYVPLSGGRLAVVVGDVSGKGVSAALLMAKMAGEVRYHLASNDDPAQAVRQINASFSKSQPGDRFVTFVAALIDPAKQQLTIVNAGHMAPILRRADGTVVELGEEEAGVPLGVVEKYAYESFSCSLAPGDMVTIFTDGISEAMNAGDDLYGIENLKAQVVRPAPSVAVLGRHILDDVRRFVGDRRQSDDICLACFGRDA